MNIPLMYAAILLYFCGTIACWCYLYSKTEKLAFSSVVLCSTGLILHTLSLCSRMFESGYFPLSKVYESAAFFSWALVIISLVLGRWYKTYALGAFVLPGVVACLCGAMFLPKGITPFNPLLDSNWFLIHTISSVTGFVFFGVSFSVGIMYLIQDRLLKQKRLTSFFYKLPPLNVLDEISMKVLSIGFFLLTLGILTGFFWAKTVFGAISISDAKMLFAMLSWILYLVIYHGRYNLGWRAKKGAFLSVLGFVCVMAAFAATTYVSQKEWHSFF
jgi:cytochrome c-type biogenesis protein CcsB